MSQRKKTKKKPATKAEMKALLERIRDFDDRVEDALNNGIRDELNRVLGANRKLKSDKN